MSPRLARATMLVPIAIVILTIVFVGSRLTNAKKTLEQAQAVKASVDEEAKAAAVSAQLESRKIAEAKEVLEERIAETASSVDTPAPSQALGRRGWAYLGVCASTGWMKRYFENLPPSCTDGPLSTPAQIQSVRGMKIRTTPASITEAGEEITRLKSGASVRLHSMMGMSPVVPNGPRIFWGEVEWSPR